MYKGFVLNKVLIQSGKDLVKALGGKVIGNDSVLGKPCEAWDFPRLMGTVCFWKGLALRTVIGLPGMESAHRAVDLYLGPIPESHVVVPSDVQIVERETPFTPLWEKPLGAGG